MMAPGIRWNFLLFGVINEIAQGMEKKNWSDKKYSKQSENLLRKKTMATLMQKQST